MLELLNPETKERLKVSNEAKTEYLNSIRDEYRKANRKHKAEILAHAQWVTKLSRNRLIKRLNEEPVSGPRNRRGPRFQYGPELLPHIKALWFLMEQPCAAKLKVLIPTLIGGYRKKRPDLTPEQAEKLQFMSISSIERMLKEIRVQRGICTTKAPTSHWYKTAIPVQPKDWNVTAPGYVQADTVSHCGEDAAGAFASTLTVTDLDSHWTEMRATFTKRHQGIIGALRDIERSLPFGLNTIKFDSGSEFMNFEVVSYCRGYGPSYGRDKGIDVIRSRPYRKNDNCYVEQKNLTHVRQFIGYDRIESSHATRLLDELYRDAWCPFLNFFMPTFKLISKERVGSRIKKKHEKPKTPYQRLMESAAISEARKAELKTRYESLDPFELKLQIEERLKLLLQVIRNPEQQGEALKQVA